MSIAHDTPVFITATHQGTRYWLKGADNERENGRLILKGKWDANPGEARSVTLELATVYRRRFLEECQVKVHFTFSAGSSEYVEEPNGSSPSGEDQRQLSEHGGFLVRPGVDTRTGNRTWFIKISEGTFQLEPIKADSPEEAVQKVIERGLQNKAERAPQTAAPQQPAAPVKPAGPRLRPGSFR